MADPDRIQINEARIRAEFDELARLESVCALLVRESTRKVSGNARWRIA